MLRAVVIVSLIVLLSASAPAAATVPYSTSTSKATFRDRAGEDPAGPDVTTVTVATDGIQLAVRVWIPSRTRFTEDMRLRVWLDVDDNRATGLMVEGLEGADHFLLVDPTRSGVPEAALYRCGEASCVPVSSRPPRFTYAAGATFLLDAFALGLERIERLAFHVVATTGVRYDPATRRHDLTNAHTDRAPDEGSWTYDAGTVRYSRVHASPPSPQAGKRFTLSMRADTAATAPPANARLTCALSIAPGRAVSARVARLTADAAVCIFEVPSATTARRFRATIRVAIGGYLAEGWLAGRIR